MNGTEHGRAIDLLMQRDVEGIAQPDAMWLEAHLQACADCESFAQSLRFAGNAVRSSSVMASAALVQSTQARIHAGAEQLREQHSRMVLIAVSFCLGVLTSTLTAWIWWKSGAWVTRTLGLPSGIVEPGVLLFWLLPAIAIAVLMVSIPPATFEGSLVQRYLKDHVRGMQ